MAEKNSKPTIVEIVDILCNMDADELSCFFNSMSSRKNYFCSQFKHVRDSTILSDGGRDIMELIGKYSKKEIGKND